MSPDELLKKLSEPADLAIFLLGFVVGYLGGLLTHSSDPPAATIAGVSGICALGLKKAADAWLFRRLQARRLRRRLAELRTHFADNPSALDTLERLTALLTPPLIEPIEFERLLNAQVKSYVETLVSDAGTLNNRYVSLHADFARLHKLAEEHAAGSETLRAAWLEFDKKYFHIEEPRRRRRRTRLDLSNI